MNDHDGPRRWIARLACGSALSVSLLPAGCGPTARNGPPPRQLSLAEFSQPVAGHAAAETGGAAAVAEPRPFRLGAGSEGVSAEAEGPALGPDAMPRLEPGDRVVVDSMVGQVNGRPIFADDFLLPIEDELIQLGRRTTPREFEREASLLVMTELNIVVRNALILAEAEAGITPEQQVGIRAWLRHIEEQLLAGHGGSEAGTRRELAREGKTLEEEVEGIKDQQLILMLLRERIAPRVIVSWRDIQRAYERNYERYNPPASMTLARIRLSTDSQAELIGQVRTRLAGGEDFNLVAESLNDPACGTWQTFQVGKAAETFANELMLEKIGTLHERGDTTEAFELGSSTWWLHMEQIDQPPGRSLYDPQVQQELAEYIRRVRGSEEEQRFIASLLRKGIYDELNSMGQRLLDIAILRYGP